MSPRWLSVRRLVVGLLLGALASGCTTFSGVAGNKNARAITPAPPPIGSVPPGAERSPQTNDESKSSVIFLVNETTRDIVPVTRDIGEPVNSDSILRELFEKRPTTSERAKGLVNIIPRDVRLLESRRVDGRESGDVIVIALSKSLGLSGEELSLATAQIVYTTTQSAPQSDSVRFLIDGEFRDLRTANGTRVCKATREDFPSSERQLATSTSTTATQAVRTCTP